MLYSQVHNYGQLENGTFIKYFAESRRDGHTVKYIGLSVMKSIESNKTGAYTLVLL